LASYQAKKGSITFYARPVICLCFFLFALLLTRCNRSPNPTPPTQAPVPTNTLYLTATMVATSTPTQLTPGVLLVTPPQTDPAVSAQLQSSLEQLAAQSSLRFSVKSGLSPQDLTPDVKLVVALAPLDNLESLASSSASIQFIALDFPGLKPTQNLSVIGGSGRPDQQGFMAGVIAAILTADWRVGAITQSDTPAGKAAGLGFHNGVVYFCGLCRPYDPPFVAYPVVTQLPSNASQADWLTAAQLMISQGVKTVYIFPGPGDDTALTTLDQAGVHLMGSAPPRSSQKAYWVASLQEDALPALQKAWPQVLSGKGGLDLPAELAITDVNPELFSPGKQELANKIMSDLLSGFIDTQVDAQTGEAH
jgi:hypothetical protein